MTDDQKQLVILLQRLENLYNKQASFLEEIHALKKEIFLLKAKRDESASQDAKSPSITEKTDTIVEPIVEEEIIQDKLIQQSTEPPAQVDISKKPKKKSDLEKFIGENLINKIGIIILVIGVAIGAKYSIENNLISPLTRIILGYLAGFGLLAVGMKLKKNYENYSAVLVSGAISIMYFITFAAYSFYELIPQTMAFGLMVIFTIFTVVAAINYNRSIIAHIGLVGAYAIPFLLSNDSGNALVLFSYIAIINMGILIISFKKYWKSLFYSAFGFTWLIYLSWFFLDYNIDDHFTLALGFASVFFLLFYGTFLAYKLSKKESLGVVDTILILFNSFIYFGVGYTILSNHETGEQYLGFFTLANALVHFIVSAIVYKRSLANKNLQYFVSGLVLTFITIAIPVQLDGNWVTLLWTAETALLFWLGRKKNIPIYEKISYVLAFLAFFSLIHDWYDAYYSYDLRNGLSSFSPILNIHFLTSVLVFSGFGFMTYLNYTEKDTQVTSKSLYKVFSYIITVLFLITLYMAFRLEISAFWDIKYANSKLLVDANDRSVYNYDLKNFRSIWVLNYSLLFFILFSWVNIKWFKKSVLGVIGIILNVLALLVFLGEALYLISELRETYLAANPEGYYDIGKWYLGIRYVSLIFPIALLYTTYIYVRQEFMKFNFKMIFDFVLHIAILWILSSELLYWMDIYESAQSYKLGLSILWGVYSLIMIAIGIWRNKKHLRVAAIVLFGVTLIKLFFYDISHLNTISKTIVFVSLGVLLLIISFLYNKYKNRIVDELEE
ncbi:DUF2339 domain-containing protein [Spongiivirga citrea]|uniref:DUF2339 domain-containing protein n=1 Tax=Spongiivirga citrea TaxID=1481457 RepID=A0A6M0CQA8_9FLAO|nr:DUF2339 domain-containing protein [Spongiivirga citrea]NER19103.1 DUF2339 domain-containing protein [Spongiivirga citrea]